MSERVSGLLGGLAEMQEIVQAHGCSFEEAWVQWHRDRQEAEQPPDNVIHVDFMAIRGGSKGGCVQC